MKKGIAVTLSVTLLLCLGTVLPAGAAPAAPSNLIATIVTAREVNLTWQDNAADEKEFRVERANDAAFTAGLRTFKANSSPGIGGLVSANDGTVSAGQTVFYRVVALDRDSIASSPSNTVSVVLTVPAAPGNLVAVPMGPNRVDLTWADNATNETSYDVDRDTQESFATRISFELLPASSTSFIDTSAQPGVTYFYRVQAVNAVGDSVLSNVVTVTTPTSAALPLTPGGLRAQIVSASRVDLSWTDVATNETAYHVERAPDATFAAGGTVSTALPANSTSFSDLTVAAGQTFFYRVHATNVSGDSPFSATVTAAIVAPAAPTDLAATLAGPGQIDLTWVDNSSNESGFRLQRSTDGVTFSVVGNIQANIRAVSDTAVSPDTTYSYQLVAYNGVGESGASNRVSATTPQPSSVPQPPADLAATAASATTVNLSWTDASALEAGFRVERATGTSTAFTTLGTVGANTTAFVDSAAAAGTSYTYRVIAFNSVGEAAPVTVLVATPTAASGGGLPPAGGGGFGLPATVNVNLTGFTSVGAVTISTSGVAAGELRIVTDSGDVSLLVPSGTTLRDAQRNALSSLTVSAAGSPPSAPEGMNVIMAREMGPSGATFNPAITLTFKYDPATLPADAAEESLTLAFWDGSEWVQLTTGVNEQADTASAQVTHFTVFALMAAEPGAASAPPVQPLPQSPPTSDAPPGATTSAPPETPGPPAITTVAPVATTTTSAPPAAAASPAPAQTAQPPAAAPQPEAPAETNWALVAGVLAVVVIALLIALLIWRRQKS